MFLSFVFKQKNRSNPETATNKKPQVFYPRQVLSFCLLSVDPYL
jgi:hypothetical protein